MQIDDLSLVEKGDAIARGDDGEQLIANVLLAVMVGQLFSITAAKVHIERSSQSLTGLHNSPNSPACRLR
jgi:hypothetical protein